MQHYVPSYIAPVARYVLVETDGESEGQRVRAISCSGQCVILLMLCSVYRLLTVDEIYQLLGQNKNKKCFLSKLQLTESLSCYLTA